MQPLHEQGTQKPAPPGAVAELASGVSPRDSYMFSKGIQDQDQIERAFGKEMHEGIKTAQKQIALCGPGFSALCETLEEVTALLKLNPIRHCKDSDFHALAEKMESLWLIVNAQSQELTQLLANLTATARFLGPLKPAFDPAIKDFELLQLKTQKLIECLKPELERVLGFPKSVCHSECGSYSISSLYDSSCSISSDMFAPDCSRDFLDSSRQEQFKVGSERAVSPERASLQLKVPPPHPSSRSNAGISTCSPAGVGSGSRRCSL